MATNVNGVPAAADAADADYLLLSLAGGTGPRRVLRSALGTPAAGVLAVSAGATGPAVRGRLDRPYATPALAQAAEHAGDCVLVYPGTYSVTTDLSGSVARWVLLPGVTLTVSGGGALPPATRITDLSADMVVSSLAIAGDDTSPAPMTITKAGNQVTFTSADEAEYNFTDVVRLLALVFNNLASIPTSDPHTEGYVWRSGADLKVSLG